MKPNEEIMEFLKENPTFYLATVDGYLPRVRPIGFAMWYNGHLCIALGKHKAAYKQLLDNTNLEICAANDRGEWLRVQGTANFDNTPEAQARAIVEALYPGQFAGVAGQRPDMPTKPDPWGVELFLAQGGYRREQCLFVGDSNVDAQTAKAAGVRCAGVTWGFRSRQELLEAGARWVVDKPGALLELVESEA